MPNAIYRDSNSVFKNSKELKFKEVRVLFDENFISNINYQKNINQLKYTMKNSNNKKRKYTGAIAGVMVLVAGLAAFGAYIAKKAKNIVRW